MQIIRKFRSDKETRKIVWWAGWAVVLLVLHQALLFSTAWPMQGFVNSTLQNSSARGWWFVRLAALYLLLPVVYFTLDQCKHVFQSQIQFRDKKAALDMLGSQSIKPSEHMGHAEQYSNLETSSNKSSGTVNFILGMLPASFMVLCLASAFLYYWLALGLIAALGITVLILVVAALVPSMKKMEQSRLNDEKELRQSELKRLAAYDIRYSFGHEAFGVERTKQLYEKALIAEQRRHIRWNIVQLLMFLVPALTMLGLMWFATSLATPDSNGEKISIGLMYVLLNWSSMYAVFSKESLGPISSILRGSLSWADLTQSVKRVVGETQVLNKWPTKFEGHIRLNGVTVRIPDIHKPILKDISLDINLGDCYLLYAPSGAGKSTFLRLLQNDCSYTGSVLVDDVDMQQIDSCRYRQKYIAVLLQRMFLFPGSVRDNMLIAKTDATDCELAEVLARVGVNIATSDITLDRVVKENGKGLSGGQQQRVAIARLLLRDKAKVLLIDEPTDSLDDENVEILLGLISELAEKGDKTIIIATHDQRFRKLDRFKVLELANGQFVRTGE